MKRHYRDGKVLLFKRPNSKKWQGRLKIGKGAKGWKRVSTGETDIDRAVEIACEKYDEIQYREKMGLVPDSRSFRNVAELSKKDMNDEKEAGYGRRVYIDYIQAIDKYLIPCFGNVEIDKIDYHQLIKLDKFRRDLLGRVPAKSTISNHSAALRRVFYTALKHGWINEYQIPTIANKGEARKAVARPYFTLEEYRKLFRCMRGWCKTGKKQITRNIRELVRDYVLILANTGIRAGTETDFKWKDISEYTSPDDGKNYLRIVVDGKTGERELVCRHSVRRYFRRIADRFEGLKDLDDEALYQVDEYVFRLRDGSFPTRGSLNNSFKQCLRDCDLLYDSRGKRRTLYSLRHMYGSFQLIYNNVDIHTLARQMGTSIGMIERHYSHLEPVMKAKMLAGKYD